MRDTGIGTSLVLIAVGAVLAFAVKLQSTVVDVSAIGAILIVVGISGLLLSFVVLGEYTSWGFRRPDQADHTHDVYVQDPDVTPPHEHRKLATRDIVYEDKNGAHVERERRIGSR